MLKQFSPFAVLFFLIGMSACSPRPMFTFDGPEKPAPIATVTFENEPKKPIATNGILAIKVAQQKNHQPTASKSPESIP